MEAVANMDNRQLLTMSQKMTFDMPRRDWISATVYLLMMALYGLDFYPAILIIAVLLIRSFNNNRYAFLIQVTLLFGGYGLIDPDRNFPIKPEDIALVVSLIGAIVYRKNGVIRKLSLLILFYCLSLFLIAMTSEESMSIQFKQMRHYFAIAYLFVPLLVFSGRDFDSDKLFRTVLLYAIIISVFYTLDGFVLSGFVLIPNTHVSADNISRFYDLIWQPFSTYFPRKYPPGLYMLALCVYPVARYYKLKKWHIFFIAMALLSCRTMTVIAGLVVSYVLVIGKIGKLFKYAGIALAALVILFYVDKATGGFMRISSTVDQFTDFTMPEEVIDGMQDEKDTSFGSGRMAQIVPKLDLLYSLDREYLGFGFLHPQETTNQKFIIINPFYFDLANSEEVATGVEVTQIQTLLDIGYVGLILQTVFFIALFSVIRRLKGSVYYLSVLICFFISGLGGFAGFNAAASLYFIAISLATVYLSNRKIENENSPRVV